MRAQGKGRIEVERKRAEEGKWATRARGSGVVTKDCVQGQVLFASHVVGGGGSRGVAPEKEWNNVTPGCAGCLNDVLPFCARVTNCKSHCSGRCAPEPPKVSWALSGINSSSTLWKLLQ